MAVDSAPLRAGNDVVGEAHVGEVFEVQQTDPSRVLIEFSRDGKKEEAWISQKDVLAYRFEAGEEVVVIRSVSAIMADDRLGEIPAGSSYRILNTDSRRVFLGDPTLAWVDQSTVIPASIAMTYFDRQVRIAPEKASVYRQRGMLYLTQHQPDKAMRDFCKSLELNPRNAMVYLERGILHRKKGDLASAAADYDRAIRFNPKSSAAYNNRANLWDQQGEYEKAIADYRRAIRVDPTNLGAYANRAITYRRMMMMKAVKIGDKKKSQEYLRKYQQDMEHIEGNSPWLDAIIGPR